jgi:uncharacterized membrane protein
MRRAGGRAREIRRRFSAMTESRSPLDSALLQRYWDWARTSIWLLPTALCLFAALLALLFLQLDRSCDACRILMPALEMDVAAARQLMGVLVTSVLSVGGVSFSVTMVALTLTSGQYGPKVLRHFLEDTRSKVSLGLFFATAVYALAISIFLNAGDQPRLTVSVALVLAILAFIEFIGFIHRTASDLQADQLIQRIGRQLREDMGRLREVEGDSDRQHGTAQWRRATRGLERVAIASSKEGYIQTTDFSQMAADLAAYDSLAMLRVRPGDFLVKGVELMCLWRPADVDEPALVRKLESAVAVGLIRTPIQDPEFPITQIQQIAARALSTGINDPGTAITCVDWLTLALAEVVDADFPGATVLDAQGNPRLLTRPMGFASALNAVYSPLRQFTASDLPVTLCLLESLSRLAACTRRADRLALLREQGKRVWKEVLAENHPGYDLAPVRQRYRQLLRRTDCS